ncbi:MAG: hypothetical protein PHH75_06805 [Candidatus Omnitrophica bacterium]|nr:hypothetical protein [Candidatus Omnitrophota bacterium]MDD5574872.1 hypothetical protein [Candidatus Omnitrophota bacterium]
MNILFVLTHKRTIVSFNILLFFITLGVIYDALILLSSFTNDARPMENLLEGIATIFVAYGVALEERDTLMKFFKLYPRHHSREQEEVDKVCHFYGLVYLLIGLFMEVAIEAIKLPHKVFNTPLAEEVVFCVSVVFCMAGAVFLLKNVRVLMRIPRTGQ